MCPWSNVRVVAALLVAVAAFVTGRLELLVPAAELAQCHVNGEERDDATSSVEQHRDTLRCYPGLSEQLLPEPTVA